jgi:hypothetical protein
MCAEIQGRGYPEFGFFKRKRSYSRYGRNPGDDPVIKKVV